MSPWGHIETCSTPGNLVVPRFAQISFFLNVNELFYLLALSNRQVIVTPKTEKYLVIKLLVFGRLSQLT